MYYDVYGRNIVCFPIYFSEFQYMFAICIHCDNSRHLSFSGRQSVASQDDRLQHPSKNNPETFCEHLRQFWAPETTINKT